MDVLQAEEYHHADTDQRTVGSDKREDHFVFQLPQAYIDICLFMQGEEDLMVMRGSFDNYLYRGALEESSDNFAPLIFADNGF